MIKHLMKTIFRHLGYEVYRIPEETVQQKKLLGIPDEEYYTPLFSPWKGYADFGEMYSMVQPWTLVSADRCYVIRSLICQASTLEGSWLECGVYKGGTAILLAKTIHDRECDAVLHLFDTFQGMPDTDSKRDLHRKGDFADTDLDRVRERVLSISKGSNDTVVFHPGFIPDTFQDCGIECVSFAHVDVDIYRSVFDCCEYIYPRLVPGGFLLFDDYGFPYCGGARQAVDEFFSTRVEVPLILPTGQALIFKY